MKKILSFSLALVAVFALSSCAKKAEQSDSAGKEFVVDTLFTHKGCTLYRFSDSGHYVYYSDCSQSNKDKVNPDENFSSGTQMEYGCGKNCTRRTQVQTTYDNGESHLPTK